jgi:hypothetical protein
VAWTVAHSWAHLTRHTWIPPAIDTMKTVLQVDSVEGFRSLMRRVRRGRIDVLFQGSIATAVSAILGHYPWVSLRPLDWFFKVLIYLTLFLGQFYTYNLLSASERIKRLIPGKLLRNAAIGLGASALSDTVVNAIRVIKTTKQSLGSKHVVSYSESIRIVLAADGWKGLFGRGLRARIFANALQSIVFTVIWRGLAERWRKSPADEEA